MEIVYNNWYVDNIERPIRELVYRLRNNGINTRCSCGHYLWVQGECLDQTEVSNIIYNVCSEMDIKNYQLRIRDDVRDGYRDQWFELCLPDEKGNYHFATIDNPAYIPHPVRAESI